MFIHKLIVEKKTELKQQYLAAIDIRHEPRDYDEVTRRLYYMNLLNHVKSLKDYPFDINTIKKFLLAACTPFISIAVGYLLTMVK